MFQEILIYRPVVSMMPTFRRLHQKAAEFPEVDVLSDRARHYSVLHTYPIENVSLTGLAQIMRKSPESTKSNHTVAVEQMRMVGQSKKRLGSLAVNLYRDDILDDEFEYYRDAISSAYPDTTRHITLQSPHVSVARFKSRPNSSADILAGPLELIDWCNDRLPEYIELGHVTTKVAAVPLEMTA